MDDLAIYVSDTDGIDWRFELEDPLNRTDLFSTLELEKVKQSLVYLKKGGENQPISKALMKECGGVLIEPNKSLADIENFTIQIDELKGIDSEEFPTLRKSSKDFAEFVAQEGFAYLSRIMRENLAYPGIA